MAREESERVTMWAVGDVGFRILAERMIQVAEVRSGRGSRDKSGDSFI